MYQAQYLFKTGASVFGPWMPRQADNIIIYLEGVSRSTGATLTAQLFHKDSETTGPGSAVSPDKATSTSSGVTSASYEGLKEFVRYQFSVSSKGDDDYVSFRMLPAEWFDSVNGNTSI